MSHHLHELADFLRQTGQLEKRESSHCHERAAFELAINALDRLLTDEERLVAIIMFRAGIAHATYAIAPDKIQ